jgi:large subunit ribosomal protein L33
LADRKRIALACEQCGARNYKTTKSQAAAPGDRLRLKKFCAKCQQHTWHNETK